MEEAINFYSVEEGLARDLMIWRERKQQQYYRLNTQNQLKTDYICYTDKKFLSLIRRIYYQN